MSDDDDFPPLKIHSKKDATTLGTLAVVSNAWYENENDDNDEDEDDDDDNNDDVNDEKTTKEKNATTNPVTVPSFPAFPVLPSFAMPSLSLSKRERHPQNSSNDSSSRSSDSQGAQQNVTVLSLLTTDPSLLVLSTVGNPELLKKLVAYTLQLQEIAKKALEEI